MADVTLPYTFSSNTTISASQMNANLQALRDGVNDIEIANLSASLAATIAGLTPIYARVIATPTITGTATAVTWSSASSETGGDLWSAGTNPTRVTVPETGVYIVAGMITPGSGLVGRIQLRTGGTTVIASNTAPNADLQASVAGLWVATATNYIEALVDHYGGGSGAGAVEMTVVYVPGT